MALMAIGTLAGRLAQCQVQVPADGRPFVAVLDDKHQLILGRWVSQDVYENGKDLVRYGPKKNLH